MKKIQQILSDLFNLNFISNTFADKKHEASVKNIFLNNGLTQVENSIAKTQSYWSIISKKDNSTKSFELLKGFFIFIEQPFGSQKSPDFIICVDGFVLWIECKSGKDYVTWNTGYPKKDVLVVFSSKKRNLTTLFFGQSTEILANNPNFEKEYELFDKELKALAKERFNEKFISKDFSFFMRKMLNDKTKYTDLTLRNNFYNQVVQILQF